MKHRTSMKTVQLVEHTVVLSNRDIARLLTANRDGRVSARDIEVVIHVKSKDKDDVPEMIALEDVLEMAIEMNEDIPEDADVAPAIRWREESQGQLAPQAPVSVYTGYQPPQQRMPAYRSPSPQSSYAAPTPQVPADAPACATCGAAPDVEGPTPECQDPHGCGRVLHIRGPLPVGTSVAPEDNGPIMPGSVHGTVKLTNRETGEQVFAAADGMSPYGKHEDYST